MGETPCFMHLFPPDEPLPSQLHHHHQEQSQKIGQDKESSLSSRPSSNKPSEPTSSGGNCYGKHAMRVSRPLAFYTYSLGKDLYIPLTSRCNTRTLPETRGPNFMLPAQVVASLCRVRDAEHGVKKWAPWCMYLDTQETPQRLPPALECTNELPSSPPPNSEGGEGSDDERLPRIQDLLEEVQEQIASTKGGGWNSIVFAGEGEPTMRLDDLLSLAESLRNSQGDASSTSFLSLRLTTNGLVVPPSTSNPDANNSIPQQLFDSGISKVSVALMTADPEQYQELMTPGIDNAHSRVCKFIEQAVAVEGMEVETTAVEQDGVDKQATEALSESLQVNNPVRWRPYFR